LQTSCKRVGLPLQTSCKPPTAETTRKPDETTHADPANLQAFASVRQPSQTTSYIGEKCTDWLSYAVFGASAVFLRSQITGPYHGLRAPRSTGALALLRDPPRTTNALSDSILTHLEAIGEIRRIAGEPERSAA
jgi:hypothetical protein